MSWYWKDPDAVLDYALDWGLLWMAPGDTLVSATWDVPEGITKESDTIDGDKARIWLSGGTENTDYLLTCTIVTSQGRTDDRTMLIRCHDR